QPSRSRRANVSWTRGRTLTPEWRRPWHAGAATARAASGGARTGSGRAAWRCGAARADRSTPGRDRRCSGSSASSGGARGGACPVLRRALEQALRWDLVARNVAAVVVPPRVVRHEVAALSLEDAARLLAAARGARLEALYVLALACGLRQGEALGLHWRDVD